MAGTEDSLDNGSIVLSLEEASPSCWGAGDRSFKLCLDSGVGVHQGIRWEHVHRRRSTEVRWESEDS